MNPLRSTLVAFACAIPIIAAPASTSPSTDELIAAPSRVEAPNFTLPDMQGKPLTLSSYKGKVVLLDFWATTCAGCKIELPWYVAFDAKYRDKGLAVIGLDMYGETPHVIKPFMAKWKMHYPVAIGTDALGEQFNLRDMPLTLLIDRHGKIALSHAGIVDQKAFEAAIQKLLQERDR